MRKSAKRSIEKFQSQKLSKAAIKKVKGGTDQSQEDIIIIEDYING